MLKVTQIILYKCWQFLALLLILFAVLITVARYMMPSINDYRGSIENLIAEQSGIQISIGQIAGSWESVGPVLEINNISFGSSSDEHSAKQQQKLSFIKSIKLSIATFPSLFYRTLITDNLTIEGLSIIIEQEQSGKFKLSNISNKTESKTDINPNFASAIQDWLQHQQNLTLFNTYITIGLRTEDQYPITLDEIHFEKGKDLYQLTGHSKLPGNNQVDFILEADGFLSEPSAVGQLYIDTHKINMAKIPLNAIWEEADISSGFLEMKLWADWKNGRFESALMSLRIDDFLMSLMNEPQTNLNKLKSYLVWQRLPDGWALESQQTDIISQKRSWPDPSVFVRMTEKDKQQKYNITASRLDLGIWADLILTNPKLDADIRQQLLAMNPNGILDDSLVTIITENSTGNSTLIDLRANARFSELTWQPWKKIPGVSNFAGQFEVHKDKGVVILDSRNAILDYPSMFRWPFNIESINSRLSWEISEKLVSLELNNLILDVTDGQLLADGLFNIHRNSAVVDMNLYAEIDKGNVAKTKYFLPTGIMKDKLVSYLDQSIKSGHLHSTQAILRGPVSSFPFTNPEGVFAINAKVSDSKYSFRKGWPEIENINADLWFVEKSMDIEVTEADSNGLKISQASVIIENFSAKPPLLLIKTSSTGDAKDGMDYINNSPLKNSIGKIFETIPTSGPFGLELDLNIPLSGKIDVRVDGQVNLLGNSMLVEPVNMAIENIQGKIKISDSLVFAKDLSAEIMGGKSQYSLEQQFDSEGLLLTTILGKGSVTTTGIRQTFPSWIPEMLQGQTEYDVKLLFPEVRTDLADSDLTSSDPTNSDPTNSDPTNYSVTMNLTLNSDLQGINSLFPAPFDKKADQNENFKLNYQVLKNHRQLITATLSKRADMKLHLSDRAAAKGQIVFGGEKATISGQDGIELTGKVSDFDLKPWLNLFRQRSDGSTETFKATDYGHLSIKNLLVENLKYYFLDFDQVTVSAVEENNALHFNLQSDEISGDIHVPDADLKLPIDIDLLSLKVKELPSFDKEISTTANAEPLSPLKIQCKKCIYKDLVVNSALVNINPLEKGNAFTVKTKSGGLIVLDLKGEWSSDEYSDITTNISGKVNSRKLGKLLRIFNLQTGIHDTSLITKAEMSWLGDPGQFNFQTLNGKLSVDGGKGSQEDVSDKGSRLFSLFSVGSLARKLTLDFSDLFGDGFYYSGLEGDFTIAKGAFSTTNFKIDGTSADVEIIGVSDFTNQKIEKCILVIPELSSSLPILAGWALTPATGVLVYLMSKIFQPALKVVTGIIYKIEGPFDDPVVTEIGKTSGTAVVDNTGEKEKMVITPDAEQSKFSCDGVFKK